MSWLEELADDPGPVYDFLIAEDGQEFGLRPPGMTLGRKGSNGSNPDIDVRGIDPGMVVSREHAALHFHEGVWHVLELRARNGTWVNNERLVPGVEMPLRSGDRIRLANVELVFEMRERDASRQNGSAGETSTEVELSENRDAAGV
jgi:pSer/pThr/pTyr-binding forkhead associated (FHA) protein